MVNSLRNVSLGRGDGFVGGFGVVQAAAGVDVGLRLGVELEDPVFAAGLDAMWRSSCDHPSRAGGTLSAELHGAVGRPVEADFADDVQDDILGHHSRLQPSFEPEMHCRRHFEQQLAVPRTKPASVLPMPVANWLNAPAMHVCESVPNSTSPGAYAPSPGGRCDTRPRTGSHTAAAGFPVRVEHPFPLGIVDDIVEILDPCSCTNSRRMSTFRFDLVSAVKM